MDRESSQGLVYRRVIPSYQDVVKTVKKHHAIRRRLINRSSRRRGCVILKFDHNSTTTYARLRLLNTLQWNKILSGGRHYHVCQIFAICVEAFVRLSDYQGMWQNRYNFKFSSSPIGRHSNARFPTLSLQTINSLGIEHQKATTDQ